MTEFTETLSHYCRNPRWRSKLPVPVSNPRVQKFRVGVEKLPGSRRGIGTMASGISDMEIKRGAIMTIAEYLAATALIALIVWAVLGLLMQES
jgi:hypothetical protein